MLSAYARARAADTIGAPAKAAEGYAAALLLSPDNEVLAARALSQALSAGDRQLAVAAARIIERNGTLAPDARLLLMSEAVRTKDWGKARTHLDALEKDEVFAFMGPVLRAWIAQGSGKGDPLAIIASADADSLAAAYAAEHRPLLLLARGKEQGVEELLQVSEAAGPRGARLRIAGAATLAERGKRKDALRLVQGESQPLTTARTLIEERKGVPAPIADAPAGIAELLVRIALDLQAQDVPQLALTYARIATFLAPENSETWLVTSALLAAEERHEEAIAALGNIAPGDPFFPGVADRRVALLAAGGKEEAALVEAEAATRGASPAAEDWARLGDVYSQLERYEEAAAAYARALELINGGDAGQPEWALWLLRGGALEQADKWPEAKAALEQAYRLAPDQPLVLNYLGYAQLERRENVEEAMKLIAEASKLQPHSPEITDSLGWAHYLRGNVARAVELLERAAVGRPADVEINEHLGDAYYSAGRRFEARYAWRAALLQAEGEDAERLRAKIAAGLTPKLASP